MITEIRDTFYDKDYTGAIKLIVSSQDETVHKYGCSLFAHMDQERFLRYAMAVRRESSCDRGFYALKHYMASQDAGSIRHLKKWGVLNPALFVKGKRLNMPNYRKVALDDFLENHPEYRSEDNTSIESLVNGKYEINIKMRNFNLIFNHGCFIHLNFVHRDITLGAIILDQEGDWLGHMANKWPEEDFQEFQEIATEITGWAYLKTKPRAYFFNSSLLNCLE